MNAHRALQLLDPLKLEPEFGLPGVAFLLKNAEPFTPSDLRDYVANVLAPLCRVHSSVALYSAALDIAEQTGYGFCDCLIVAAAAEAGYRTLYTEDLDAGRSVAGVTIANPF